MEIRVKNVKCGDCSLVSEDGHTLIVDCGSSNRNGGICARKFAYAQIESVLSHETPDLMISHYDSDHYCGILCVPPRPDGEKVFARAYLPWTLVDGSTRSFLTEPLALLAAVAPRGSWGLALTRSILDLFQKLEETAGSIRMVKRGDSIALGGKCVRVLWPDTAQMALAVTGGKAENAEKVDARGLALLLEHLADRSNFSEAELGATEKLPTQSLVPLLEQLEARWGFPREEYTDFAERLHTYLVQLHRPESPVGEHTQMLTQVMNAFYVLSESRMAFHSRLSALELRRVARFARKQYHALVNEVNAMSIVCAQEERFIYLGDVPARVVEYLHDSKDFAEKYCVVKIQHHATPSHYTNATPAGGVGIVSNGGYKKRKVGQQFVAPGAPTYDEIVCTNARVAPSNFCEWNNCKNCRHLAPTAQGDFLITI